MPLILALGMQGEADVFRARTARATVVKRCLKQAVRTKDGVVEWPYRAVRPG